MKIATFGSWIDQSDRGWRSKGSRQEFEETCHQIGRKIAELGHSVIVGSSKMHTADRHVVAGIISYYESIGGAPSSNYSIKVIRSSDEADEYGSLSKKWQKQFIFSPRENLRSDGVKILAVKDADAVITIGGAGGTYLAGLSAILAKKPFSPIASFGGASEQLIGAARELGGSTDLLDVLRSPWNPDVLETAFQIAGMIKDPGSDVSAPKKIFVVHGHDEGVRDSVARYLEHIGLKPIILHEQPNKGRAIITKFQEEAADIGFAVVLMTPDDHGSKVGQTPRTRARQNVVFELGFFIGALGPDKVAALVKGDVEKPSDFDGVGYISLDQGHWKIELARDLRAAGFEVNVEKVIGA